MLRLITEDLAIYSWVKTVVYISVQLFIDLYLITWITVILVSLAHLDHRALRDPWVHVLDHVTPLDLSWDSACRMHDRGSAGFPLVHSLGGLSCGRPWFVTSFPSFHGACPQGP
jgi:hypothetical protein